jgi:hypothetical protein
MTKANGRGRGWRRKAWQDLAPVTQKKYRRYGIDATRHNRGYTPRLWTGWVERQEQYYGRSPEEVAEELEGYDRGEVLDVIREQERAESLYANGDTAAAQHVWENRNHNVPEWMYYYHGVFS